MSVKCILTGQTPSVLDGVTENVQTQLNDKVDKVTGKGLSTNDYTDAEKTKLSGIETGAQKNTITGVKGSAETTYRTGNVNITATNIGLGNVNNTSDAEKPISTATKTALDGKQATITGAATTITDNNLTANRALISNSSGKVEVSSVTSTELGYLDGVTSNIQTQLNNKLSSAPVTSVNNKTGAVTLAKGDVGLGNVDNTSDANKPISNATQAALNNKQSKITANGILKGDGSGNISAANETEVELVSLPYICNPNLLDNWYFGNPVNQRGQTSWNVNDAYTIDRWKIEGYRHGDTGVTLNNNSVTIFDNDTPGGDGYIGIYQPLENNLAENTEITISVLTATGLCVFSTTVPETADTVRAKDFQNFTLYFYRVSGHQSVVLRCLAGQSESFYAVKLELGSQQTLAHQENGQWVLNEIPKFGDQLTECQRYYRQSWVGSVSSLSNSGCVGFCMPNLGGADTFHVVNWEHPMRTIPSVTVYGYEKKQPDNITNWVTDKDIEGIYTYYISEYGFALGGLAGVSVAAGTPLAFHYIASADL